MKIAGLAGQHIQKSQNTPNLIGREESRRSNSSDQTRLYRKLTRLKLIKLANTLSEYDTLPDRQLSNTCVGAHRKDYLRPECSPNDRADQMRVLDDGDICI